MRNRGTGEQGDLRRDPPDNPVDLWGVNLWDLAGVSRLGLVSLKIRGGALRQPGLRLAAGYSPCGKRLELRVR